ncbi:hypothetical protein Sme01_74020 [Sphaerisporangium melleum]|uniref:Peptidase inhibitor family I36 n=1 Tax=Sphaerisporangium melleum TaxID=321316 RepID=A0A917RSJ3_9ACTN|nr:hypothetical protein [Sphaerisporangium melleum]GGL20743.1 hypothetical protein GCM10007964_73350 [Sphaerisporangium melleum]GII74926.1 hypothetical protein Sme01_74020 [Sphaerisporangium melleum]
MRKLLAAGASAVALLGLSMVVAPPASADSSCPSNYSCYWQYSSFTGTKYIPSSCGNWSFPGGIYSVKNYGNKTARLRDSSGKIVLTVPVGGQYAGTGSHIFSVSIDC